MLSEIARGDFASSSSVKGSRQDNILTQYDSKLRIFLEFVLGQYIAQGVGELDRDKLPQLLGLQYHSVNDAVAELGDAATIRETFVGFQRYLYDKRGDARS